MIDPLVIGSRGSQLALWQARWIQARLAALGVESRIEIIKTTGDKITDVALSKVGGKGLFTKEIEDALLAGAIDCAVHSLKDLPTELPAGLTIAAVPEREDSGDALVGTRLAELGPGAKVGTSSLRRAAQLRAARPDLVIESIRGNLDTRLRKLDEGQYDAIVLAAAGLRRLGWADRIAEVLPREVMTSAVGQGALAVETRDDGGAAYTVCARLDDAPTRAAVAAERSLLQALGGGCQAPVGAYARIVDGLVLLDAVVISQDGAQLVRAQGEMPPPDAAALGQAVAQALLANGAQAILDRIYTPLKGQRVVVTRASTQAGRISERLRELGADVVELPVIQLAPTEDQTAVRAAVTKLDTYDWVIFTSANAVEFFLGTAPREIKAGVCAIGPATAQVLQARGVSVTLTPDEAVAESIVEAFAEYDLRMARVLLPRAAVARDVVPEALRERGATVDVVEVYRNVVPEGLADAAKAVWTARPDWVLFTSSSTVQNLVDAVGTRAFDGVKVAVIGPVTAATARQIGLTVAVEATAHTADGLIDALREYAF